MKLTVMQYPENALRQSTAAASATRSNPNRNRQRRKNEPIRSRTAEKQSETAGTAPAAIRCTAEQIAPNEKQNPIQLTRYPARFNNPISRISVSCFSTSTPRGKVSFNFTHFVTSHNDCDVA